MADTTVIALPAAQPVHPDRFKIQINPGVHPEGLPRDQAQTPDARDRATDGDRQLWQRRVTPVGQGCHARHQQPEPQNAADRIRELCP
ncbi:hypothetical protein D3C85_1604200 [compost metagenome]